MSMKKAPLESELSKSALFPAFFLFVELASLPVIINFRGLARSLAPFIYSAICLFGGICKGRFAVCENARSTKHGVYATATPLFRFAFFKFLLHLFGCHIITPFNCDNSSLIPSIRWGLAGKYHTRLPGGFPYPQRFCGCFRPCDLCPNKCG